MIDLIVMIYGEDEEVSVAQEEIMMIQHSHLGEKTVDRYFILSITTVTLMMERYFNVERYFCADPSQQKSTGHFK